MNTPEYEPSSIARKAIAAFKQQQEMSKGHLEGLKLLRLALDEEFESVEAQYLAQKSNLDKQIAAIERELAEADATLLALERMAGPIESGS
jgi:vacuolar-type H+-ATPase subunit D/Vma8